MFKKKEKSKKIKISKSLINSLNKDTIVSELKKKGIDYSPVNRVPRSSGRIVGSINNSTEEQYKYIKNRIRQQVKHQDEENIKLSDEKNDTEIILTKEQISKYTDYLNRWGKIGLSTEPTERDLITPNLIREKILGYKPAPVVYMSNPLNTYLKVFSVFKNKDYVLDRIKYQTVLHVQDRIETQIIPINKKFIGTQLWDQIQRGVILDQAGGVLRQVQIYLEDQIWNRVMRQKINIKRNKVKNKISDLSQINDIGDNPIWNQQESVIYPYIGGHFSVGWFALYDFVNKELGIEFSPLWDLYMKTTRWGFFYPLENITIICDKPKEINMKNGLLHAENRPAILYAGEPKFEIYCLNGVKVSEEIVMTPVDELDPHLLLTEINAQVRCEIVRKIGVERILNKLNAKILDDKGAEGYCLYNLDLGDGRQRPYLRMFNSSEKVWHIEGVLPECDTVEKALEFRNKSKLKPLLLT